MATEFCQQEALYWVHDTFMLLVPFYLRAREINAKIGFSMHSHFPSSDIYKTFLYRLEVLKSMMMSDLISFHSYETAKCFMTATTRMLHSKTAFKKGGKLAL